MKITDIALSSTVNASELNTSMVPSRIQPTATRASRKFASSLTTAFDCPGAIHSRARPSVESSSGWPMKCESAMTIRISSGTMDSSV